MNISCVRALHLARTVPFPANLSNPHKQPDQQQCRPKNVFHGGTITACLAPAWITTAKARRSVPPAVAGGTDLIQAKGTLSVLNSIFKTDTSHRVRHLHHFAMSMIRYCVLLETAHCPRRRIGDEPRIEVLAQRNTHSLCCPPQARY